MDNIVIKSKFKHYLSLVRPATLIASAAPVLIAAAICEQAYSHSTLLITLICALALQSLANASNDLLDGLRGTDKLRPDRIFNKGVLSLNEIKVFCLLILAVILATGFYLILIAGIKILFIGLASILFAYLYTGGKYPLAYLGLGEVLVIAFFGFVPTLGTLMILGSLKLFTIKNIIFSCIPAFASCGILVFNNLRDQKSDFEARKMTLVARFGESFGRLELFTVISLSILLAFLYFIIDGKYVSAMLLLLLLPQVKNIFTLANEKSYALGLQHNAKYMFFLTFCVLAGLAL